MLQNEKENLEWLESLFRENYPQIKILNKAVTENYSYTFQVKLKDRVKIISFRRHLIDDKRREDALSIIREQLNE